jgi:hypothetical protein
MLPGTTEWTCPDCGHEHGGTTMGQLQPDEVTPPEEAVSQPAPSVAPSRAATAGRRRSGPPTRGRLAAYAVGGIAGVLVVAFVLSAIGDGGDQAAATSPPPSVDPVATLCLHLRDLQTPREDSLARLADTLQTDAATFQLQGDTGLAQKVLKVRTAALAYRDALAAQGDLTQVAAELGKALARLPC